MSGLGYAAIVAWILALVTGSVAFSHDAESEARVMDGWIAAGLAVCAIVFMALAWWIE